MAEAACVPSLSQLCTTLLCKHAQELLSQASEVLPLLPTASKAALLAVLRRLLTSEHEADLAVRALADDYKRLDLSGCALSDAGCAALAQRCCSLRALDVRACPNVTSTGLRALLAASPRLEVLRVGGCPASNRAARGSVPALLPRVHATVRAESWEESDVPQPMAPLLRWLVWPEADARSRAALANCPRIELVGAATIGDSRCISDERRPDAKERVETSLAPDSPQLTSPQAQRPGQHRRGAPVEADLRFALDAHVLAPLALDSELLRPRPSPLSLPCSVARPLKPRLHIAELFRLAFVARDERLQPKRDKNWRQSQRRVLTGTSSAEDVLARCTGALRNGGATRLLRAGHLPVDSSWQYREPC